VNTRTLEKFAVSDGLYCAENVLDGQTRGPSVMLSQLTPNYIASSEEVNLFSGTLMSEHSFPNEIK